MDEINPRNDAYLGYAVWELFIRAKSILLTNNAKKLHKFTTDKVKGHFQAELLEKLENTLTEEEKELARCARSLYIPVTRRSCQSEYRQATAFEALIGFWSKNNKERFDYIISLLEKELDFSEI